MLRLIVFAVAVLLVSVFVGARHAYADEGGKLSVEVHDAVSQRSIEDVRIAVSGPISVVLYTDLSGAAEAVLPAGHYRLLFYSSVYIERRTEVDVETENPVKLLVSLSPRLAPRVISRVRVVRTLDASEDRLQENSATSRVLEGLGPAVASLPDVSIGPNGLGFGAFSPTGTNVRIDGVSVGSNGNSPLLGNLGLDLFSSVTASPLNAPGGAALDLTTPDPTIAAETNGITRFDTLDGFDQMMESRGTSGYLGYAVRAASRSDVGPLDSARYLDRSGLVYDHSDSLAGNGLLLKLRAPLTVNQSVAFEGSSLSEDDRRACAVDSGGVPCGQGPNVFTHEGAQQAVSRYTLAVGKSAISAYYGAVRSSQALDASSAYFAGSPNPLYASSRQLTQTLGLDVSVPFSLRDSFSAQLVRSDQTVTGPQLGFTAFSESTSFSRMRLTNTFPLFRRSDAAISVELRSSGNAGYGASVDDRIHVSSYDAVDVGGNLGTSLQPNEPDLPLVGTASDPGDAIYDCRLNRAYIGIPASAVATPSESGVHIAFSRETQRFAAHLSLSHDIVSSAALNDIQLDPAVTSAQIAAINSVFSSANECDSNQRVSILGLQQVITTLRADRATFALAYAPASNVLLEGFTQGRDERFSSDGAWHPEIYVPSFRGGVLADIQLPKLRAEAIAFAQYQGANNIYGLGPFTTLNLGFSRKLQAGALSVSLTNAMNTYAGSFATSAIGSPLADGLVPVARPLTRRTLHIDYRFSSGPAAPEGRVIDAGQAIDQLAQPAHDTFTLHVAIIPSSTMTAPFEPATTSSSCYPELVGKARAILETLRRLDRAGGDGTIDDADSTRLGARIEYRRQGPSEAFTITITDATVARAFYSCVPLHFATVGLARERRLYVPDKLPPDRADIVFFDRRVGEYTLLEDGDTVSNSASVKLASAPPAPPVRPFELLQSCPTGKRGFAQNVLNQLQAAVKNKHAVNTAFFHFTPHIDHGQEWDQVDLLDPQSVATLEQCNAVVGLTMEELTAAGISFAGDIAFSERYGLYVLVSP